jgi:chemotaxis protein methyltransferase CheR
MKNLKIKEVKDLIRFIADRFGVDFSQYAYVSFKIKLEQFFTKNKITDLDSFFEKFEFNENFRQGFYSYVFNYEFELFRDPALWRSVKEEILKKIKGEIQFRVCIPSCYQGAELLSFLILRDELGLQDKVHVIYTSNLKNLSKAIDGFDYEERKHALNLSNYKRIEGKELADSYFIQHGNKLLPNKKLFVNTSHLQYNELDEVMRKKSNLIIYRNRLLNFNRTLQVKVVNNLIDSLKPGGFLVLGVKERLVDDANRELFTIFNLKESIYKKKI